VFRLPLQGISRKACILGGDMDVPPRRRAWRCRDGCRQCEDERRLSGDRVALSHVVSLALRYRAGRTS
jgi:hypothetical protein